MGHWTLIGGDGHGGGGGAHDASQVLAIHAALLGDGRVLYFSGSEHNAEQHNAGLLDHSRIWDPETGVVSQVASPAHDLFCSGHAFLGDGRLLVAGGTKAFLPTYLGAKETSIFEPEALAHDGDGDDHDDDDHGDNPWKVAPLMHGGRWYPTLLTLPDGRVLCVSGILDEPSPPPANIDVEVFDHQSDTWEVVGQQPEIPGGYPRMHLLPDGRVLCVTAMAGMTRAWSPIANTWTDVTPGPGPEYQDFASTSVLLPLLPEEGYRARVMVTGAAEARILDLGAPELGWQPAAGRGLPGPPVRNHACAVLLPDATVLVCGGTTTQADDDAVLTAECYHPAGGAWEVRGTATVPRVYHNVTLLLPDGRVWTAGSNHNGAQGHSELRMEVYEPPYLAHGARPEITNAPAAIRLLSELPTAEVFQIETPQADTITSVAIMRRGSITHAFDADQRYVGLAITGRAAGVITVAAPPTSEIAPPGWYSLYILDHAGVPSLGRAIEVQAAAWTGAKGVPFGIGDETAGAGVAVADISGSGQPDIIQFHVDNPGGANAGFYRIGYDLNHHGDIEGGWSDLHEVPGFFGDATAGAGIATGDLSGSGRPDLVVFHVDNPEGGNAGYYRVGTDLDAGGVATGGWSEHKAVPGWWGDETAGAGVALADISGTGRPDLVVFHVDNPGGGNTGYYRIGWDLDAAGDPQGGWSGLKAVPGFFGDENAGGGVAVADISGSGRPDIVVFHIDNPGGGNRGYYRIGWDLSADGDPDGGWTNVKAIPGWFGDETGGADLAIADVSGKGYPELVALHVDNPEATNQGYYRVLLTCHCQT